MARAAAARDGGGAATIVEVRGGCFDGTERFYQGTAGHPSRRTFELGDERLLELKGVPGLAAAVAVRRN